MSGDLTTLGAVVARTGGVLQTGPFGSQLHASDYKLTGKPLVMPVNLGDNEIRETGIARIGVVDAHRLRRHALREGDIVFSRRGDVGRRSLVRAREAGWLCGTGCLAARFGSDRTTVNPAYVADYLGGSSAQAWLVDNAVGGTMPNLNTSILAALPVWLPSKLEQDRIVAALEDVRKVMDSLQRRIAKNQAIKQGMMQQLLTCRIRLPGFGGRWTETRLGKILKFQPGFPFSSEDFSESPVGPRLVRNRDLRSDDSKVYYTGGVPAGYVLASGDLLVGMDGDFEPVLWSDSGDLLNQRVGRLRLSESASAPFLAYALVEPLKGLEQGTGATTVKHLSHRDVEDIVLGIPCRDEQDAIAAVLSDLDGEIDRLHSRLVKARAVKVGMMQQLLTGRTRLTVEAAS